MLNKNQYAEYESFVSTSPKGHFCQSIMWSKVKSAWAFEAVVERNENGEIIGALGILIRKVPFMNYSIMYAPRGPVCDVHDKRVLTSLIAGVKELAKRYHAYIFKMDPDVKSSDHEFSDIMKEMGFTIREDSKTFDAIQPRYVFRLDIKDKTSDEVMAQFHSKTRYNIRVAIKNGVTSKIGTREDLKAFYDLMLETGMRDDFVTRPLSYFERMYDALGEHMRLYLMMHDNKPISGSIAIHYGDKVWYLYGASSNAYRNVMPNYLMQWEMINWALELKCNIYDFRGVAGIIDETHPLYGLYRFKKGFNGEFTEFVGEMNLVLNPFINKLTVVGEHAFKRFSKIRYKLKNRNSAQHREEKI
ncbi:MAG: peptidoglycan bridge formation glycyltransferase FemA/FemB family protein [Bacillota bacterium]|nr:peptidoglycan bridge formation glycyltransferase FemA/FemB family protein [Bacillota bacterium]